MTLILKVTATLDAPATNGTIYLPQGIQLVDGIPSFKASLEANNTIEHEVTILPVTTGLWKITAFVQQGASQGLESEFLVYIRVGHESGEVFDVPPSDTHIFEKVGGSTQLRLSGDGAANIKTSEFDVAHTAMETKVSGCIQYEDDRGVGHPVRYATVELWQASSFLLDIKLSTTSTFEVEAENCGKFEFIIQIDESIDIYAKVLCQSEAVQCKTDDFLPDLNGQREQEVTLTYNESGRFVDTWVDLKVYSNKCPFTRGMDRLELPVRHGEGKFDAPPETVAELNARDMVVLRYAPKDGDYSMPYNPNGSLDDIAAICNERGNVMGIMPHPEGFMFAEQHPLWTRKRKEPIGLEIFRNAVEYVKKNL